MELRAAARFIGVACEAVSRIEAEPFIEAGRLIEVERSFAAERLQAPVTMAAVATTPPPAIPTTRIAAAITAASIAVAPCIAEEPSIAGEPPIAVARLHEAEQCEAVAFVLLTMAVDGVADQTSRPLRVIPCLQSSVLLSKEFARRLR